MIRFRCHRCKRPIAAPDGRVGKKVRCPGCNIVTIVPDIPGAQAARAAGKAKPAAPPTEAVVQGPPDPLDMLAAAVDGDVETASFDDSGGDEEDGGGAARRVRRKVRRGGSGADVVLWIVLGLLAVGVVIGLIAVLSQRN